MHWFAVRVVKKAPGHLPYCEVILRKPLVIRNIFIRMDKIDNLLLAISFLNYLVAEGISPQNRKVCVSIRFEFPFIAVTHLFEQTLQQHIVDKFADFNS